MSQEKKLSPFLPTCELAAGMLFQDHMWLVKLYILQLIPAYLATFTHDFQIGLSLQIIARAVELLILFLIGKRWLARLKNNKSTSSFVLEDLRQLMLLFIYGFTLWILFQGPAILLLLSPAPATKLLGLVLWPPAIILALAYYFYFFPILLGQLQPLEIHNASIKFFKDDRLLALKTMLAPLALMLLLVNILGIFLADNSVTTISFSKAFFGGIFVILSSYLALAVGFLQLSPKQWHDLGLDPYREARFTTLRLQGPNWLAKILLPANGLKFLLIAMLLGLANLAATADKPPNAEISVVSITVADQQLVLRLIAKDPKGKLQDLIPQLFNIAGPEGQLIGESRMPSNIIVNGQPFDLVIQQPLVAAESSEIQLTFQTDRKAASLQKLEDLYLWYRQARLQRLEMNTAQVAGHTQVE